eukprot:3020588-Pleurochrysis_carterae.AAC.2
MAVEVAVKVEVAWEKAAKVLVAAGAARTAVEQAMAAAAAGMKVAADMRAALLSLLRWRRRRRTHV